MINGTMMIVCWIFHRLKQKYRTQLSQESGQFVGLEFNTTFNTIKVMLSQSVYKPVAGLGGSVGCAVRLETRRSRVQPPPRSATFFRGDWSWNIFYGHSPPSADSRRAVVSFWLSMVGKNFSRWHFEIFFLCLPENRLWHSMQIVSFGDNLHELSRSIFWGKSENYYQSVICWICREW